MVSLHRAAFVIGATLACALLACAARDTATAIEGALGEADAGQDADIDELMIFRDCNDPRLGAQLLRSSWAYELIPNVVSADGSEPFVIELTVRPGELRDLRIDLFQAITAAGGARTASFADDGQAPDRRAGDGVFTAGPFRYDSSVHFPDAMATDDPNGPGGVAFASVGQIEGTKQDGTVASFVITPELGLLAADAVLLAPEARSERVQATPSFVNVRTDAWAAQLELRHLHFTAQTLTKIFYDAVPDSFDFLNVVATNHLERFENVASGGSRVGAYNAGAHTTVRSRAAGLGADARDQGACFGSAQRLLGLNLLTAGPRGLNTQNVTHETLHQFGAYALNGRLAVASHYDNASSVGSLLGGFRWDTRPDGSFVRNCDRGRNGDSAASPLDLYFMGLILAEEVPPIRFAPFDLASCGQTIVEDVARRVTIADVVAAHGVRTPLPADAQRDYRVAFVAETNGRLLTPREMTFYDTIARRYTAPIPDSLPAPYIGSGLTSIQRFFGHGTTWRSDVAP